MRAEHRLGFDDKDLAPGARERARHREADDPGADDGPDPAFAATDTRAYLDSTRRRIGATQGSVLDGLFPDEVVTAWGDPREASVEIGRALLDFKVESAVAQIRSLIPATR